MQAIINTPRASCCAQIDRDELEDGLNALGVYVTEEVVEEIMEKLDADGSGAVDYSEFITRMFPVWSQGFHE
jgi:Ca2+-binding EF-hand superfamily protein